MPHGSGHAGGGHHGGGYHGGGYHHHHGHYYHGGCRCSLGQKLFWLIVAGITATLATVLSIRFGAPSANSYSNEYTPNETRAFTYSAVFCNAMSANLKWEGSLTDTEATLYVLSEPPQLIDHDSFDFTEVLNFDYYTNYHTWYFYLYPGSVYSMSACKESSDSNMKYFLFKGKGNFNDWKHSPNSFPDNAITFGSITSLCSSTATTHYTYNVDSEGEYYWVFYLTDGNVHKYSYYATIKIDVYRTKYHVTPATILSNCTVDYLYDSYCVADVPIDDDSFGLVTLDSNSDDVDWSRSQIKGNIDCNPRIWVFVIISIACVVFVLVSVAFAVAFCCYLSHRSKNTTSSSPSEYTPLSGKKSPTSSAEPRPASTSTAFTTDPSAGPPPSYSPPYQYGSTASASSAKYYMY